MTMTIPTLHQHQDISLSDIQQLIEVGFCYFTIDDDALLQAIKQCHTFAYTFFQTTNDKSPWQLRDSLQPGELYQGYTQRKKSDNTSSIEQFFFEPAHPYGPFKNIAPAIAVLNQYYHEAIFHKVVKAVGNYFEIPAQNIDNLLTGTKASLKFQYYQPAANPNTIQFDAHRDFGLLTVLFIDKPGLEVYYNEQWIKISPKPNTVVLNIGNALQAVFGGSCHSALHRVANINEKRLSIVMFNEPNPVQPLLHLSNQTEIAPSGQAFFDKQFQAFYQENY